MEDEERGVRLMPGDLPKQRGGSCGSAAVQATADVMQDAS